MEDKKKYLENGDFYVRELAREIVLNMVYFDSWDEFAAAVEQLCVAEPRKFRFVVKYRHCDGKLVLKGTDDQVCLKYRTEQQQDIKKLEKLNSVLMRHAVAK